MSSKSVLIPGLCHRTRRQWFSAAVLAAVFVLMAHLARAERFTAATYNVENLFDAQHQGTEYPGYVPGRETGWDARMLGIKLDNLCRVIGDLAPQIIGLQEVESRRVLEALREDLQKRGLDYPYAAIADSRPTTVKCALLSMYPLVSVKEIRVPGTGSRSILQAEIDVCGRPLVAFVNHWKSKTGPESRRMAYARALAAALETLPEKADYLLMGDFNSNYDEFRTMQERPALNDTGGKTGINHVLGTVSGKELVDESRLIDPPAADLHYNLWLELAGARRWSARFFGRPQSPDAILLPAALYDDNGISYVDNSFDKFDPGYLFSGDEIRRWQRARNGRGRHLGRGFSDHLPVFACFTHEPFSSRTDRAFCGPGTGRATIADLYTAKTGAVRYRLNGCTVIYRHADNAVLKQKNGRAIYVYKAAEGLREGRMYAITVSRLKRYYGNLEITGIAESRGKGRIRSPEAFYISDPEADLADPDLRNEVIGTYCGSYARTRFFYGNGRQIRLYFQDKSLAPDAECRVCIRHARIGYHNSPELVIEKPEQIQKLEIRSTKSEAMSEIRSTK